MTLISTTEYQYSMAIVSVNIGILWWISHHIQYLNSQQLYNSKGIEQQTYLIKSFAVPLQYILILQTLLVNTGADQTAEMHGLSRLDTPSRKITLHLQGK